MLKKSLSLILLLNVGFLFAQHDEQTYYPDPDLNIQKRLTEWQDLKFGLLMHWGAYSQWGIVESWSICPEDYGWCERKMGANPDNYFEYKKEYEKLKTTFNPVKFDPEKWAQAARDAGMKYVVFTTKHHDGFCMFDSKETDYKVTGAGCPFSTHLRANITKAIFEAFRNEGLWAGAYFSKPDWHCEYYWDPYFPPLDRNVNYDPHDYPEKWEKFVQFTHNQIMELMTDYGQIDILWLDGGWVAKKPKDIIQNSYQSKVQNSESGFLKSKTVNQDIRMDELVQKAREKQPHLIVVDRAVPGVFQNYLTPENRVPDKMLPYPWESCIIMGGGWSYTRDAQYKSARELVHMLVDIVAKGGNLLLNIGPGPDGTWHDDAYDRLAKIGDWLEINHPAIYGSKPIAPYKEGTVCLTTQDDGGVYAVYLADENEPAMPTKISLASISPADNATLTLLGHDGELKWERLGNGFAVAIPPSVGNNPPCQYAWTIRISELNREDY
ncbi:alpha-L-fucosidase [candidate division KSB1 bacterium]|nr:alpha-L-fucosidase [candidate division KSB1 bacterium]RQW00365.1 MAG: alpha-L-fucosidase [candidate division KSB1 bacterium]